MNLKDFFTTHAWWGKFLGAFFGFLVAGPTGAIFGLLVGNFFDRGLVSHYSNPLLAYLREKRSAVQKVFFNATFSVMGYLAKVDGRVSEREIHMARLIMDEMHLNKEQKILAMHLFNEGKKPQFNLNSRLAELLLACRDNRELLKLFIDIQYQAAKNDGLTLKKIQVLDTIFSKLGFMPFHKQYRFYEDFGSYSPHNEQPNSQQSSSGYSSYSRYNYKPTQSNLEQAYALMELPSTASQQEVKRAYRRLLSRNHPDKLIAKGMSQDAIKMANEKTQKIVKAYELICESKGW